MTETPSVCLGSTTSRPRWPQLHWSRDQTVAIWQPLVEREKCKFHNWLQVVADSHCEITDAGLKTNHWPPGNQWLLCKCIYSNSWQLVVGDRLLLGATKRFKVLQRKQLCFGSYQVAMVTSCLCGICWFLPKHSSAAHQPVEKLW